MVSGNLLQLNSQRNEDIYLYGNPQTTYFKKSYMNARNFSIDYSKVPYTSSVDFGTVINVDIPKKGDLLGGIYFNIELSEITKNADHGDAGMEYMYINGIGHNIIKEVQLTINGINVQTFNGELIYLINSLNNCTSKQTKYQRLTHCEGSAPSDNSSLKCYLPIPFFFSGNPELYLPVCSLNNSRIELKISFRNVNECIVKKNNGVGTPTYSIDNAKTSANITKFEITTQYIHIGEDEKKMFLNAQKLDYLIPSYSIGSQIELGISQTPATHYIDIDAKHPTRYILWLLQKNGSVDPHDYLDAISNTDILINNTPILENVDTRMLSKIQLYERFEGVGPSGSSYGQDSVSTIGEQLHLLNFSLNPSVNEPKGTFNLSSFRHKQFRVTVDGLSGFTSGLFRYYTSYFNILVIENGMGGLIYQ